MSGACDEVIPMSARSIRPAALLALPAAAVLLAGCTFGPAVVKQADVEKQVSSALEKQVGQAPDSIECPDDLPAEVGAEMTCVLTADETTIDVTVTVDKVDGNNVGFDIKVADAPN